MMAIRVRAGVSEHIGLTDQVRRFSVSVAGVGITYMANARAVFKHFFDAADARRFAGRVIPHRFHHRAVIARNPQQ